MNIHMKRRITITAFTLTILALSIYGFVLHLENTFTVVNQTGQALKSVRVVICDQSFDLGNVRPGDMAWRSFQSTGSSSYNVLATLWDGTTAQCKDGYVARGSFGVHDRIVIKGDRSVVVQSNGYWP